MKNALLAAAILLAPAFASAGEKYVVRNGRAVSGGSRGGSGGGVAAGAAKGGMAVGPGGGVSGGPVYSGGGGNQAFVSGGRRATGGHRSFYGGARTVGRAYRVPQRALESGGSGSGEGGGEESETPPDAPGYFKYGAKIVTEGQKYQFAAPAGGERQNVVSAGEVALDHRRAHDVNKSHGLRVGAPDKLPPCTPGSNGCGGGAGGNSITANAPSSGGGGGDTTIINNGAHDNQNGNNGGNNNGNGFGGGTGFDPSF